MTALTDLLTACKVQLAEGDRVEDLPNGEVILYADKSHRYWRLTPQGRETLYSVSSVLGVLDKPGLLSWVRTVTLQGQNYWDVRDEAGTRGTSTHTAGDVLASTGKAPALADFPVADRGYVQAMARFWLTFQPKAIATEVIVASIEHGFAGRFDLLAEIEGARVLLDYKTSKRIYPVEMFAQLEAYEGASVESGHPPTDKRMIVRLGEDGSFEVAESCATFADFLGIKAAFDAQKRVERAHKAVLKAAA